MKLRAILFATITPLLMVACDASDITDNTPLDELKEVTYTPLSYDEEASIMPKICNPDKGYNLLTSFNI